MQCARSFAMHNQEWSLTGGIDAFHWPLFNGDGRYCGERRCDHSLHLEHKNMMRWIMLNHESTFRFQVQELHRLYGRQRELMNEAKRREKFMLSQTSGPSCQQSFQLMHQDRKGSNVEEIIPFYPSLSGSNTRTGQQSCSFPIDLNHSMASSCDGPFDTETGGNENMHGVKSEPEQSGLVNADSKPVMDFDLNSVPNSSSDEMEMTQNGNKLSRSVILHIDLNSTIPSDEENVGVPSCSDCSITFTEDAELMFPVSPENQEGSPLRVESEDAADLSSVDVLTAKTLVEISSTVPAKPEMAGDSLSWFAEIVSSAGDDLRNGIHGSAAATLKEQTFPSCKMAKKSCPRPARTRLCTKAILTIESDDATSSRLYRSWKAQEKASKCPNASFSEAMDGSILKQPCRTVKSWGKTGKRQGGCRRRSDV